MAQLIFSVIENLQLVRILAIYRYTGDVPGIQCYKSVSLIEIYINVKFSK